MLEVETIEAEIVFLIRQMGGQWPAHQTEIHFHASESRHREAAETIARRYLSHIRIASRVTTPKRK